VNETRRDWGRDDGDDYQHREAGETAHDRQRFAAQRYHGDARRQCASPRSRRAITRRTPRV